MNAPELIAEFDRVGIRLWEEAGQLRFRAPQGALTEERRAILRDQRNAVVGELRRQRLAFTAIPEPEARHEPFPLTDVQSAYLLGRNDAFGFGNVSCHLYVELEFAELQPRRVEEAWNLLIRRHDMLRAVVNADYSQQVLAEVPPYRIPVVDLGETAPEACSRTLTSTRSEMDHRVFKTMEWPLFELRITQAPLRSILHFSIDFMIADWASIQVLLGELQTIYRGRAGDLPALDLTFRDYVLAQRRLRESSRFDRDRTYWWKRIDELPDAPELPVLGKAADGDSPRFRRWSLSLPPAKWAALRSRGAARGVTPSGAVLAAYAEVIGAWSRRRGFTLNLTLLNRLPLHPQVDQLVGDFTSVSLLSVDGDAGSTFERRATAIGTQLFEDLDHATCSGVEVMRELGRRRGRDSGLMPVVFTSAIGLEKGVPNAETVPMMSLGEGITQTPQVWVDCQAMDRHGELRVNWDVREGIFPDGLVDDMFAAFETFLRRLSDDDEAWLSEVPVGLPAAQAVRRAAANRTGAPESGALLHERVYAQALSSPDRIAVVNGERSLTYGELLDRAAAVAAALRDRGCRNGELVAVVMQKGWEQVVGVLGSLLAGAAYLPIDVNQPAARSARLVSDSGAKLVLTQSWVAPSLEWSAETRRVSVDALVPMARTATPSEPGAGNQGLAYVIYTSGSTGTPKGVMISHRSAVNTVDDVNRRFRVTAADTILGVANLSFDLSVYDVFGPLAVGGCLVIPDNDRRSDPSHWAELIVRHGVTLWNSVPAQLQMLVDFLESDRSADLSSMRMALLSGDWIPLGLPGQVRARMPRVELVSLGGATEASIWSIYHQIDDVRPEWRSIPYGKPLANQSFHVLDSSMRPCPDWTVGELYIGGVGLALGYLGDPAKTAEQFIEHPRTGERLYRTGDLGRYLPDASIEFLGRDDLQVKIRGHRIEPAEIESVLGSYPGVRSSAVVVYGSDAQHRRLVGFVTQVPEEPAIDVGELVAHASVCLPDYMVPSQIHVLSVLPCTANGKIDREALCSIAATTTSTAGGDDEEPRTDLEHRLARLWAETLDVARVGRNQDFFQLGGDSLLAAKLVGRMREQIPEASGLFFDSLVRQLLPQPTVAALASYLAGQRSFHRRQSSETQPASPLVSLNASGAGVVRVLIHDGTGRLGPYGSLLQRLAAEGPTLGLVINEIRPYLRLKPDQLVERRAASYARLLRTNGYAHVHVVGYGLGALLAMETARQLGEGGVEVEGLTLISSYAAPASLEDRELRHLFARELGAQLGEVGSHDASGVWPGIDAVKDTALLYEVFCQSVKSTAAHGPTPYLGDVTICWMAEDVSPTTLGYDPKEYWERLCLGDVHRMVVPGRHGRPLESAAAEATAQRVCSPRTT